MTGYLRPQLEQLVNFMPKHPTYKYSSLYEYFLREGSQMLSNKPTTAHRKVINRAVRALYPKQKECFLNAQRLALADPELFTYCEGYVLTKIGFAIHHGWTRTESGVVVDPTLRLNRAGKLGTVNKISDLVIGTLPAGLEYWGRTFTNDEISACWLETKTACSLVDRYDNNWALLRGVG